MAKIDDEYLWCTLDYLELKGDLMPLVQGSHTHTSSNITTTAWSRLPIYDGDFGRGRPIFMGHANIYLEGHSYIFSSPTNDGSLFLAIRFLENHIAYFEKLFYEL